MRSIFLLLCFALRCWSVSPNIIGNVVQVSPKSISGLVLWMRPGFGLNTNVTGGGVQSWTDAASGIVLKSISLAGSGTLTNLAFGPFPKVRFNLSPTLQSLISPSNFFSGSNFTFIGIYTTNYSGTWIAGLGQSNKLQGYMFLNDWWQELRVMDSGSVYRRHSVTNVMGQSPKKLIWFDVEASGTNITAHGNNTNSFVDFASGTPPSFATAPYSFYMGTASDQISGGNVEWTEFMIFNRQLSNKELAYLQQEAFYKYAGNVLPCY